MKRLQVCNFNMKWTMLPIIVLFNFSFIYSQSGIINTVVSKCCTRGYYGDGGPASNAELYNPESMYFDTAGNMLIADMYNNVIRKVDHNTGLISTLVGNGYGAGKLIGGYTGDGGNASAAEMDFPSGVIVDKTDNIYIFDAANNAIRKIDTIGVITTIAGIGPLGQGYSGDGGPATSAELFLNRMVYSSYPKGMVFDNGGNLYITDAGNNVIRRIAKNTGIITTLAGNYLLGSGYSGDGGPATAAELNNPNGLAIDKNGNLYISDYADNVIREVNLAGVISTFAGNGYKAGTGLGGYSGDGGQATVAELWQPDGLAFDTAGNLYIAETGNMVIREINKMGIINTVAGSNINGYSGDGGLATLAELAYPSGVIFDNSGNLFLAGGNVCCSSIREINYSFNTGIEKIQTSKISVYPNPSNGNFNLTLSNIKENFNVEIFNILGEKVFSRLTIDNEQLSINLGGQPNGIYLYRVLSNNGRLIGEGKIIIQK